MVPGKLFLMDGLRESDLYPGQCKELANKLPGSISDSRQEDGKKYSFFTKGVDFLYKGVVNRYFRERPAMVKMREIEEKLKPILEKELGVRYFILWR